MMGSALGAVEVSSTRDDDSDTVSEYEVIRSPKPKNCNVIDLHETDTPEEMDPAKKDINKATKHDLLECPLIGPVTAEKILKLRAKQKCINETNLSEIGISKSSKALASLKKWFSVPLLR